MSTPFHLIFIILTKITNNCIGHAYILMNVMIERGIQMKSKIALLGGLLVLVGAAFLDAPPGTSEKSNYFHISEDDTVDANVQTTKRSVSSSYEYVLDSMNEVEGYIVESYREYEIHRDTEGNEIVRIPTENYQYLKYHKE